MKPTTMTVQRCMVAFIEGKPVGLLKQYYRRIYFDPFGSIGGEVACLRTHAPVETLEYDWLSEHKVERKVKEILATESKNRHRFI